MTSKDGESPSTSSLFLPQLRYPRRGSLGSLSNPSQLEGDVLAQALDQIHIAASRTETLTTFNEYTSPPSSSSGADGKGIASELQGGLSGLYSRFRASVGNVKDIVTLGNDDGAEDKSIKSLQTDSSSSAPPTRYPAKLSSPSATAINLSHGLEMARQSKIEVTSPELGANDKDQHAKMAKFPSGISGAPSQTTFSSGSVLHSPLPPFTQGALGTAVRPAVAEVNVSAAKERDASGDVPSNGVPMNPVASQKQIPNSRAETHLSGNADKQSPRLTENSRVLVEPGSNAIRVHEPKTTLESAMIAASRSGTKKEVKHTRERGSLTDEDYFIHPEFDGIDNVIQATSKRPPSTTKNATEAPRIITNPPTPRDDVFLEATPRIDKVDTKNESLQDRQYQHFELPAQKSSVPPQAGQLGSRDRRSPLKSSFESTTKAPTIPRSSLLNREQLGEVETRQITAGLQPRVPVIPQQDEDFRTMNVFSQIKSKILNKEYWMRDENAQDCFYCGDPFSTFRRKHHCSKHPFKFLQFVEGC